jgi:hypothetical protein
MIFVACTAVLLGAATVLAVLRPSLLTVALTFVAGAGWALADKPVEGYTIVVLSRDHGITIADLFSVLAVLIALTAWAARPRSSAAAAAKASEQARAGVSSGRR